MPLPASDRKKVNQYVFKHVVPKNIKPRPKTAMEWFVDKFNFIEDAALRKHLGETLYQGRYIGRLMEALNLKGAFNNTFVKQQIILYASIYEAVMDHFLSRSTDPRVQNVLKATVFKKVNAFSSKTKMTFEQDGIEQPLFVCKQALVTKTLKDVRFRDRLQAAVDIGMIPSSMQGFIEKLYTSRNNVHVIGSAKKDFHPDANESSEAFKSMFRFLKHVEKWAKANAKSLSE